MIEAKSHTVDIVWNSDRGTPHRNMAGASLLPTPNPSPKPFWKITVWLQSKKYPQCTDGYVKAENTDLNIAMAEIIEKVKDLA